mmetsp:Transcript_46741/g.123538  ORF Transcript_46741/g.123538 Transcript_46741/m.123538 type:complete len:591 (-) Transcript_46741:282-2054(-)
MANFRILTILSRSLSDFTDVEIFVPAHPFRQNSMANLLFRRLCRRHRHGLILFPGHVHCDIGTACPGNHFMELLGVWNLGRLRRNAWQREIELHTHDCASLALLSVLLHFNPVLGHVALPELNCWQEQKPPSAKLVFNEPPALDPRVHDRRRSLVLRQPGVLGQQGVHQSCMCIRHRSSASNTLSTTHFHRSVLASVGIPQAAPTHAELLLRPHVVNLFHNPVQEDPLPAPEALDQPNSRCCPTTGNKENPFRLPTIQAPQDDGDDLFSRSQDMQQFDSELQHPDDARLVKALQMREHVLGRLCLLCQVSTQHPIHSHGAVGSVRELHLGSPQDLLAGLSGTTLLQFDLVSVDTANQGQDHQPIPVRVAHTLHKQASLLLLQFILQQPLLLDLPHMLHGCLDLLYLGHLAGQYKLLLLVLDLLTVRFAHGHRFAHVRHHDFPLERRQIPRRALSVYDVQLWSGMVGNVFQGRQRRCRRLNFSRHFEIAQSALASDFFRVFVMVLCFFPGILLRLAALDIGAITNHDPGRLEHVLQLLCLGFKIDPRHVHELRHRASPARRRVGRRMSCHLRLHFGMETAMLDIEIRGCAR